MDFCNSSIVLWVVGTAKAGMTVLSNRFFSSGECCVGKGIIGSM